MSSLVALCGCGVSKSEFDAKAQEATAAKQEADAAKQQVAQLQQQLTADDQQVAQLKGALGMAQSQAITDEQKSAARRGQARRAGRAGARQAPRRPAVQVQEDDRRRAPQGDDAPRARSSCSSTTTCSSTTGEADVKPAGKTAIGEVAATLKGVGLKRFQVAGHTDSEPITTATKKKFPTNWELSAARAIAVVKLLVADGVAPGVLSAAGYGPYDPVASNASPDGQAKNRRIEITLVPNVTPLVAAAEAADKTEKK